MFTYPASDLDEPQKLLALLGSFWAGTYQGRAPVQSLLNSRALLDAQNYVSTLELLASMSRFTVPVFHRTNWRFVRLLESQQGGSASLARFNGQYLFDGVINWGEPAPSVVYTWSLPINLTDVRLILNRMTEPSITLVRGVDFDIVVSPGETVLVFRDNPFAADGAAVVEYVEGDQVVEREVGLWLYRGLFDWQTVYEQFGYAVGLHMRSSQGYRDIVNAVFDAMVDGGTVSATDRVCAAAAGVPIVQSDNEVVINVFRDERRLWVITDKNAYAHSLRAETLASVGDVMDAGAFMSNAVEVLEFNRGQVPVPETFRALAVGNGFLASGYSSDLVFENKTVDWLVEENVDGFTKVSFSLGGDPDDAVKFWNDVHAAGVTANQTLAMLLDQRPADARSDQPTALALPDTVNPLGFLVQNLLRNNVYVVIFRPHAFGEGALGVRVSNVLRRIIPAGTAVVFLVELAVTDDPIILSATGNDAQPGCSESFAGFLGGVMQEDVSLPDMLSEQTRGRQAAAGCD